MEKERTWKSTVGPNNLKLMANVRTFGNFAFFNSLLQFRPTKKADPFFLDFTWKNLTTYFHYHPIF